MIAGNVRLAAVLVAVVMLCYVAAVVAAVPPPGAPGAAKHDKLPERGEIIPGLPFPQALQGHDDENWPFQLVGSNGENTPDLIARYAVLAQMQPGIRRYNFFWNTFETAPSQSKPFACPTGSELIPSSESQRKLQGFHRFHCFNTAQLRKYDTVLSMDRQIGAQNAAILYSAPSFYRHENCTGFPFGKDWDKGGCIPTDDHLDDYEDFVNMLLVRYGDDSAANKLSHLIVWNEVASAGWMDCSPLIPNRAGVNGSFSLTDAEFDLWVTKYAQLMERTNVAAKRNSQSVMIWSSNDRLWDRPIQKEGAVLHSGVEPFLQRLWTKIGSNFTWSLAVHPYDQGNPNDTHEFAPGHHPRAYTFATLGNVVEFQKQKLKEVTGLDPASAAGRPYTLLYASEQGWPSPACCNDTIRGRNICYAHALSHALPEMVAVTHNFFHDNPHGSEQGGQDYGLIAGNITSDFSNGPGYPTYDAYVSTSPMNWGKNAHNFCCAQWQVGCPTVTVAL